VEPIRIEDRRPWLRRVGALSLLCALGASAAVAFVAEARQRREVTRRARENLASITHLASTRLNQWLYFKTLLSLKALDDGPLGEALRASVARGRGDDRQRELLGLFLKGAGFSAAGLVDPSGCWLPDSGVGDLSLLCENPCLNTALTPACFPHKGITGLSQTEFPVAVPGAEGGAPAGFLVFVGLPQASIPEVVGWFDSYTTNIYLEIIEQEGDNARILWTPASGFQVSGSELYPLASSLPAQEALYGMVGPGEGPDTEGLPYLFATSYIARTRWGVVARVPREDVLAPVRTTGFLAWGFTLALILAGGIFLNRMWSRSYWKTLGESHALLAELVKRLLQAQEEERTHLSHELHDGLAQYLAAAQFHLGAAQQSAGPTLVEAREELERVSALLTEGAAECRRVIANLRPPELEEQDLVGALSRLAPAAGPPFRLEVVGAAGLATVPPEVKYVLYRIAQEAVANAVHHAEAREIVLGLRFEGEAVVLEVRDDGRGFDPHRTAAPGHFGLAVMRERAGLVGGELELCTEPGHGTVVRVRVAGAPARTTEERARSEGA